MSTSPAIATVRAEWHYQTIRQCQMFVCTMQELGAGVDAATVETFLESLPPPAGSPEAAYQRLQLLEFSLRWAEWLHAALHGVKEPSCAVATGNVTSRFWASAGRDVSAVLVFRQWFAELHRHLCDTHPAACAHMAASRLRVEHRAPLDVARIAAGIGFAPALLRRQFRATFGMSMREYQTRLRVVSAIRHIASGEDKIDAVARESGFRSRKGFYRAIRTLAAGRPGDFRHATKIELDALTLAIEPRVRVAARPA